MEPIPRPERILLVQHQQDRKAIKWPCGTIKRLVQHRYHLKAQRITPGPIKPPVHMLQRTIPPR